MATTTELGLHLFSAGDIYTEAVYQATFEQIDESVGRRLRDFEENGVLDGCELSISAGTAVAVAVAEGVIWWHGARYETEAAEVGSDDGLTLGSDGTYFVYYDGSTPWYATAGTASDPDYDVLVGTAVVSGGIVTEVEDHWPRYTQSRIHDLATDAVTLAGPSLGDLIYRGATGWDNLPIGDLGEVLTVGTSGLPAWADAASSGGQWASPVFVVSAQADAEEQGFYSDLATALAAAAAVAGAACHPLVWFAGEFELEGDAELSVAEYVTLRGQSRETARIVSAGTCAAVKLASHSRLESCSVISSAYIGEILVSPFPCGVLLGEWDGESAPGERNYSDIALWNCYVYGRMVGVMTPLSTGTAYSVVFDDIEIAGCELESHGWTVWLNYDSTPHLTANAQSGRMLIRDSVIRVAADDTLNMDLVCILQYGCPMEMLTVRDVHGYIDHQGAESWQHATFFGHASLEPAEGIHFNTSLLNCDFRADSDADPEAGILQRIFWDGSYSQITDSHLTIAGCSAYTTYGTTVSVGCIVNDDHEGSPTLHWGDNAIDSYLRGWMDDSYDRALFDSNHALLSRRHSDVAANDQVGATFARGAMIVAGYSGGGEWQYFAPGSYGQVLTVGYDTGQKLYWQTPPWAPADASYLTLGTSAGLSAERVLQGTEGLITIADGGANGAAVLATGDRVPLLAEGASIATGDLLYGSGAGVLSALAAGTATQVLHMGTALLPEWVASSQVGVTDHGALDGLDDDDHTQYLTSGRADSWLATKDTDDLGEGSSNLYFSDARARAALSAAAPITYGTATGEIGLTTPLAVGYGGTGLAAFTAGDLLYASAETTLAALAAGTATQVLHIGTSLLPEWVDSSQVGVTDHGALSGLSGDDHPQYARSDADDALSGQWTLSHDNALIPDYTDTRSLGSAAALWAAIFTESIVATSSDTNYFVGLFVSDDGQLTTSRNLNLRIGGDRNPVVTFAANALTFNQNVGTTSSPTFLSLTITGLIGAAQATISELLSAGTAQFANPLAVTSGGLGLSSIAAGDLLYGSGEDVLSVLAAGTATQVLTMGTAGIPEWADAAGGVTVHSDLDGLLWSAAGHTFDAASGRIDFFADVASAASQGLRLWGWDTSAGTARYGDLSVVSDGATRLAAQSGENLSLRGNYVDLQDQTDPGHVRIGQGVNAASTNKQPRLAWYGWDADAAVKRVGWTHVHYSGAFTLWSGADSPAVEALATVIGCDTGHVFLWPADTGYEQRDIIARLGLTATTSPIGSFRVTHGDPDVNTWDGSDPTLARITGADDDYTYLALYDWDDIERLRLAAKGNAARLDAVTTATDFDLLPSAKGHVYLFREASADYRDKHVRLYNWNVSAGSAQYSEIWTGSAGGLWLNSHEGDVNIQPADGQKVYFGGFDASWAYLRTLGARGFTFLPAAGAYSRFGEGTTNHGLDSNADLLVSGELEVNGTLFGDGNAALAGALTLGTALGVGYGGTGLDALATGDLLYASAEDTLAALTAGTAAQVLTMGTAGVPEWADAASSGGWASPMFIATTEADAEDRGHYATVQAAVTAAGAVAGESVHPVVLVIGRFSITTEIVVPEYVSIVGLGREISSITQTADAGGAVLRVLGHNLVRGLSLVNTGVSEDASHPSAAIVLGVYDDDVDLSGGIEFADVSVNDCLLQGTWDCVWATGNMASGEWYTWESITIEHCTMISWWDAIGLLSNFAGGETLRQHGIMTIRDCQLFVTRNASLDATEFTGLRSAAAVRTLVLDSIDCFLDTTGANPGWRAFVALVRTDYADTNIYATNCKCLVTKDVGDTVAKPVWYADYYVSSAAVEHVISNCVFEVNGSPGVIYYGPDYSPGVSNTTVRTGLIHATVSIAACFTLAGMSLGTDLTLGGTAPKINSESSLFTRELTIQNPGSGRCDLKVEGKITSQVATGTAPVNVSSTTVCPNLNVDKLDGHDWGDPLQQLLLLERTSDPTEPTEGTAVLWMSDGTGKGDDGDVLIVVRAGSVTRWATVYDHSAGSAW